LRHAQIQDRVRQILASNSAIRIVKRLSEFFLYLTVAGQSAVNYTFDGRVAVRRETGEM